MDAQQRSLTEVTNIALKAQSYSQSIKKSPAFETKQMNIIHSSEILKSDPLSPKDEAFYVCIEDSKDSKGFVIVSGDVRMPEVLGYSYSGHFDIDHIPVNFRYLLECYASQKENIRRTQFMPSNSLTSVEPLLKSQWNQDDPYNRLCPLDEGERSATGCVATAVTQIMNFYQYPACGTGLINYITETKKLPVSLDLSNYPFDWSQMLDYYTRDNFTDEQATAVAQLMYAVGAACNMDYTKDWSSASSHDAMYALFNHFGYDSNMWSLEHNYTTDKYWFETIVNELNASRPLLFAGTTRNNEGHAFVVDGYQKKDDNLYFSINWGWGGYYDGYFICTDLNPEGQGIGGSDDAYNFGQTIIVNCVPENGDNDSQCIFSAQSIQLSCNEFDSGKPIAFNFQFNYLFNRCVKSFNGTLRIVLVDEASEEERIIDECDLPEVGPNYGWYNLSLDLSIDPLPNGNYTVKAYSVSDETNAINEITSATDYPHFHVGRTGLDFTNDGLVNKEDLAVLIKIICNNQQVDLNNVNTDLNHDGRISVADLTNMILRMQE